MGSAFNAITTIKRAVVDPITDDKLPPPGALSWGGINSDSALEGTTGIDCKLVHGDRWQQVEGSQTENFSKNVTALISGKQKHTVKGDRTLKIGGNLNSTVHSQYKRVVLGPEITKNYGPVHWHFAIHRHISEPHRIDWSLWNGAVTGFQFSATSRSYALVGKSHGFTREAFSLTPINTSAVGLHAGCTAASFTCEVTNQNISCDKDEIKALKIKVRALEAKVGVDAQGPPCSAGAN